MGRAENRLRKEGFKGSYKFNRMRDIFLLLFMLAI